MIRLFFGRPGEGMSYAQVLAAPRPGDKPGTRMEALCRLCGAGGMGVQTPHVALRATRAACHGTEAVCAAVCIGGCDDAAADVRKRSADGGAASIDTPPSNTGVNKVSGVGHAG